jgi:serine/threonine protein phosphatase PrpC
MRLRAGVASDCGLVRPANEDSFLLRPGLYAVCDGMGGARAGEVASQMACLGLVALDPASAGEEDLRRAIASTNKAITSRSASEEHLLGMGTTITVALVKPGSLIVAHVGDSRAYVLHAGELAQVTDDHSWVGEMVRRGEITLAQAAVHPHRSVITRALGTDGDVTPDTTEVPLAPGDRVLLCSDGLTGMVTDQVIAELLQQGNDPQETADALMMAALAGGGEDNVTAIVVHVEPDLDSAAGEDGARAVDDRILFGPSDRDASVAPPSPRSRRASTVRERLGRRVTPLARPVGAPPGSVEVAPAEAVPAGPAIAETAPDPIEAAGQSAAAVTETAAPETQAAGMPVEPSTEPATVTSAPEAESKPVGDAARARKRRRWIYWTVVVVLVVAIAVGGLAWFNSTVYYVGSHDGKVALFNGLPAAVLGIDLSSVYEQSTVDYASLTPYMREQVDSHDLVSKTEGQQFLRTLSGGQ